MTHPYVASARLLIGRPFRHRGRGPDHFDCVGLLAWVIRESGGDVADQNNYARTPHGGQLQAAIEQHCGAPISIEQMRPGDFLLLRERRQPMHVAIVADYLYGGHSMIHADARAGRVVEHRIDARWLGRVVGVYRHGA